MSRQKFVSKFWPLAVATGAEFGMSPVAIIAHALKEAGADNPRAARRHNYFGFLKAGKHLVYSSDEAGFTAYARRLSTGFPAIVAASGDAAGFASAVAFSSYVHDSIDKKTAYAKTLRSIYGSVAADVKRLGLDQEQVAGPADNPNII